MKYTKTIQVEIIQWNGEITDEWKQYLHNRVYSLEYEYTDLPKLIVENTCKISVGNYILDDGNTPRQLPESSLLRFLETHAPLNQDESLSSKKRNKEWVYKHIRAMTVSELITKLGECDPHSNVWIDDMRYVGLHVIKNSRGKVELGSEADSFTPVVERQTGLNRLINRIVK